MYNLQLIEERIMSLAVRAGLSKNKLLINANLSKSVFDNMKKGQIPSVDKIHKIADYLGCSVDYLLGRTDESSLSGNVIGGNVTGGTVVQGSHSSRITIGGDKNPLTDEEAEILRLFQSLDVRRRVKLLDFGFALDDEAKSEKNKN